MLDIVDCITALYGKNKIFFSLVTFKNEQLWLTHLNKLYIISIIKFQSHFTIFKILNNLVKQILG